MPRTILFCVLLCFAVPAFTMPERAAADEKILDATIDRYMEEAAKWEPRIKEAATTMFWILATVSMVFTFAFMFARGNTSLGDFFGEFLRFIVTTGFFFWLLNNGSAIAKAIITSFGQLGMEASSTYQSDLSPSNLISFALDLIMRSCGSFGEQDITTSVIALLLSIAIAVLFGIIASMMVLLLCSAWVLVYAGVIYLGFGGGRWTSDIAVNYFKTVLGLAVQTFVFCLLVGIGQGQIERLIAESYVVKSVTVKGYVYDSVISTTSMTIAEGCIILIFTVVLFMLVKTVPQMIAGVISGASIGGIQLGGGAAAGIAAAASGGTMIAMQMAGAGMALSSAYQQTKENKSNGEGLFKGGSLGGGLAGAMQSAGDFALNLASGASGAFKDGAQKETALGGVSANIDAQREESKKEREANEAKEKAAGGADTSAGSGGGEGGEDGSGGDSGDGDGSGTGGGDGGASPSDGGGGGSFDWGGAISGDWSDPALDEWNAMIQNHDPSKVGLIDDK